MLTADEADSAEPGPELDKWIAANIFDWTIDPKGIITCDELGRPGVWVPDYSTDLETAMRIEQRLYEKGREDGLEWRIKIFRCQGTRGFGVSFDSVLGYVLTENSSLSLAICHAAVQVWQRERDHAS